MNNRLLALLSLFASSATLVCCALPMSMVALGLGGSLVTLLNYVPQLIWISENKDLAFFIAGFGLVLAGLSQWRGAAVACPLDPKLAQACARARRASRWVYVLSVALFSIGLLSAYVIPRF